MKLKYYPVNLSDDERKTVKAVADGDGYSGQIRTRARILLALDEGRGPVRDQADIADVLKTSTSTIHKTSRLYHEGGVGKALSRRKRAEPPVPPKVDGEVEARVIALACSKAPDGHARWTLRLLEEHVALMEDMPDISDNTIGRLLKKHRLSLT